MLKPEVKLQNITEQSMDCGSVLLFFLSALSVLRISIAACPSIEQDLLDTLNGTCFHGSSCSKIDIQTTCLSAGTEDFCNKQLGRMCDAIYCRRITWCSGYCVVPFHLAQGTSTPEARCVQHIDNSTLNSYCRGDCLLCRTSLELIARCSTVRCNKAELQVPPNVWNDMKPHFEWLYCTYEKKEDMCTENQTCIVDWSKFESNTTKPIAAECANNSSPTTMTTAATITKTSAASVTTMTLGTSSPSSRTTASVSSKSSAAVQTTRTPASQPTHRHTESSLSASSMDVSLIVGIVLGVLAMLAMVVLVLVCRRRRKRAREQPKPLNLFTQPNLSAVQASLADTGEHSAPYQGLVSSPEAANQASDAAKQQNKANTRKLSGEVPTVSSNEQNNLPEVGNVESSGDKTTHSHRQGHRNKHRRHKHDKHTKGNGLIIPKTHNAHNKNNGGGLITPQTHENNTSGVLITPQTHTRRNGNMVHQPRIHKGQRGPQLQAVRILPGNMPVRGPRGGVLPHHGGRHFHGPMGPRMAVTQGRRLSGLTVEASEGATSYFLPESVQTTIGGPIPPLRRF